MSGASVATAPVTVDIAGVQVDARDSRAIFNAHLQAAGEQPLARPPGIVIGPPQGSVDAAVVAPKTAPPPTPAEQAAKVATFDAEMRGKGLASVPGAADRPAPVGEPDGALVDALTAEYRRQYERLAAVARPELRDAERAKLRTVYEAELSEAAEGRKAGESRAAFIARRDGTAPPAVVTPAAPTYTPEQWTKGHETVADANGWIPIERINKDGLSGYTLPNLVAGQQYHSSVFAQLATARAAGVTQAQVDSFVAAGMKADGWLK